MGTLKGWCSVNNTTYKLNSVFNVWSVDPDKIVVLKYVSYLDFIKFENGQYLTIKRI